MSFLLEELPYQDKAIKAVVGIFEGQQRNFFHNPFQGDVHPNILTLGIEEITANKRAIIAANNLREGEAHLCNDPDYCIEMETGTGKTLVYLRTIYELCEAYGFTKFIIIVPSVAIREGVLDTIQSFGPQLHRIYGPRLHAFEYDSKKLTEVKRFISGTDLQVMVMTTQSFNSDDNIINQAARDDSPEGLSYWQALARIRPVLIMDEPQEGMDTPNIVPRLEALDPVARLRYSATHKVTRNLLYRLSAREAYNERLVKKLEVLSVAEKNDEATLKLELVEIQTGKGDPKAKLKAWCKTATGFKYKETRWLDAKKHRSLEEATGNVSYRGFAIETIRARGLRGGGELVKFSNGIEITSSATTGDVAGIFRQQLYWLCFRHFEKTEFLRPHGIKPLSLIFIDRVASYTDPDGLIRTLFREEFPRAYRDHYGSDAPHGLVEEVQAYYFAKTSTGEFTDSENSMAKQKEIYDEILRDKEALLAFSNPRQFIFSHSALGVGWDNPNVFNIATLNYTYSDIKKRQEIGRGLRICRNQEGKRVHDPDGTEEGKEINLLTVIPNETYETFVTQYQTETGSTGITPRHIHKGKRQGEKKVRLQDKHFKSDPFRRFWKRLGQRTDYTVHFEEETLIGACVDAIKEIEVPHYEAEIVLTRIDELSKDGVRSAELGRDTARLDASFSPLDLVEELSETTQLAYPTLIKLLSRLPNQDQFVRNPPRFLHEASRAINRIKIEEMVRTIDYRPTGEHFGFDLFKDIIPTYKEVVPMPERGVYDHAIIDSGSTYESTFAKQAEMDPRVVCVLKLPEWYKIPTPAGNYTPDFGIVVSQKSLRDQSAVEIHLVVETKSTSVMADLDTEEQIKIKCAIRHFHALGVNANTSLIYQAPVDRIGSVLKEDEAPYGGSPAAMGYFAPKTNLPETLSQALATE